jgi:tetratricopeptide (TPR) repeat protein
MIIANEKAVQAGQGLNFAVPGREIAALRPGPLRSLAKARDELTADWRPPINRQIDTVSLRPFSRGDFAGALPYFQAAVAREPEVADHWLRLGLCHENLSSYTPAAEAYRRCVALDPGCAMGWNNLGVVAIRQRRYDEAIVAISKALALRPDLALAYANLADAYHRQGRHDEAIKVCAQALTRNRNNAEARYVLGLAYLGLGRTDLALEQARLLEPLDRAQAERLRQKAEPGPPR